MIDGLSRRNLQLQAEVAAFNRSYEILKAEIIGRAENQLSGHTTKSFSRGLKDLKSLL